jgi:hypothetical protein
MMKPGLDKRGAVMAIVALSLFLFLALLALVVDLGQGLTVRTQLQSVADAAALAAASQLDGTLGGITNATAQANAYCAKNQAAGYPVSLLPGDIEFGYWDMPTRVFNLILPGGLGYPDAVNAVRLTTRRDAASGTQLATTFARSFGRNTMDVSARAVAERGGPSKCVDSSDPTKDCNLIPVAVCQNRITHEDGSPFCRVNITVGDTPSQSGALTSFYDNSSSQNIVEYVNGTKSSPSIYARPCGFCPSSSMIQATQGVDTPVFNALQTQYNNNVAPCRSTGSGPACEDSNGDGNWEWKAYVAVMCADCNDPSQTSGFVCVRGFARVNIEEVCSAGTTCSHTGDKSTKAIYGFLKCGEQSQPNSGGGGPNFGTLSPIPGLVQ